MRRYLLTRLLTGALTLLGITLATFAISRLAPGGPADRYLADAQRSGAFVDEARLKDVERVLRLDRPLHEQYTSWVSGIVRFDFGDSLSDGEAVRAKVLRAASVTFRFQLLALTLIFALAVPLGLWAALRQGSRVERAVTVVSSLLYSIPNFVLASALIWFLCIGEPFEWFPLYGHESLDADRLTGWAALEDRLHHMVLPVLCLSLAGVVVVSRYARSGMLEALENDFVRAARARGLRERTVVWRHVVRHGLVPVVTLLGFVVPALLSGSVIVESVFTIPGLGTLTVDAIDQRDYPTVMALATMAGVATLVGFLLSDLALLLLDPRISLE